MSTEPETARHEAAQALVRHSDREVQAAADRFLFVAALHDAGGCGRLEYLRARKRFRTALAIWKGAEDPTPAPAGPAQIYIFEEYAARWRGPNKGFR